MKYTYTAVITPGENDAKFYCRVPDLPGCITTGKNLNDAIDMIRDAASVWLVSAEDHQEDIPLSTEQHKIQHDKNDILSIVQIDTIAYRAQIDTRAVRKSVSIPAWMADVSARYGMNLSQLLQDSIRNMIKAQSL